MHNFNQNGFESLAPKYAGGRPPTFTLPQRHEINKIALARPTDHDLAFSTWSLSKLARTKLHELADVSDEQSVHADVFTANKERLMTTITGSEQPEVLDHRFRMYPRLAYRDEHAALEYLTRVFGFKERREARVGGTTPDGFDMGEHMLAWLEFGAGLVMIGHVNEDVHRIRSPRDVGGATTMIMVEVDDVDAHYARAVAEGAEITRSLEDMWYGARAYEAADLEGHQWHFQESSEHIRGGGTVPA